MGYISWSETSQSENYEIFQYKETFAGFVFLSYALGANSKLGDKNSIK